MKLRDYQQEAIDNIRLQYSKGNKRILAVAPTGSGKGVILSEIIQAANDKGKTVLFLVHRREILFQIQEYLTAKMIPHGTILAGEEAYPHYPVQIATVQTLRSRMKRQFFTKADVIIVDEAHNATAKEYRAVIDAMQDNLIIGFTATPCRASGKGLGTLFDVLINVATIKELTEKGYLVPIKYYAPSEPDLTGIKVTRGDYAEADIERVMNQPTLVGDIVENWVNIAQNRQTVVFTTTVRHSIAVCEAFNKVGIPAEHVDGMTDKALRAETIKRFKAGYTKILCNCSVFTEGVDIPAISCVVMARPTKSLTLYMQAIGRGMRPFEGKTDMLYIDHAGACYEHGPVDEMTEWTLDEKTKNGSKENEERKENEVRPITCEMCFMVYQGQLKCPQCGHTPDMTRLPKDVEYIDAELGLVCFKTKKVKKKRPPSMQEKEAWYNQLQHIAIEKGYKSGWVAHKYKQKFGVWPQGVAYEPIEPTTEVLAWVRGQNARQHIARKAMERKKNDKQTA